MNDKIYDQNPVQCMVKLHENIAHSRGAHTPRLLKIKTIGNKIQLGPVSARVSMVAPTELTSRQLYLSLMQKFNPIYLAFYKFKNRRPDLRNTTIFTYGQSKTGKTHTLYGDLQYPEILGKKDDNSNTGYAIRLVQSLQEEMEVQKRKKKYELSMQFYEVNYMGVKNLLTNNSTSLQYIDGVQGLSQEEKIVIYEGQDSEKNKASQILENFVKLLKVGVKNQTQYLDSHTVLSLFIKDQVLNQQYPVRINLIDLCSKDSSSQQKDFKELISGFKATCHGQKISNESRTTDISKIFKDVLKGKEPALMISCVSLELKDEKSSQNTIKLCSEITEIQGQDVMERDYYLKQNDDFQKCQEIIAQQEALIEEIHTCGSQAITSKPASPCNSTQGDRVETEEHSSQELEEQRRSKLLQELQNEKKKLLEGFEDVNKLDSLYIQNQKYKKDLQEQSSYIENLEKQIQGQYESQPLKEFSLFNIKSVMERGQQFNEIESQLSKFVSHIMDSNTHMKTFFLSACLNGCELLLFVPLFSFEQLHPYYEFYKWFHVAVFCLITIFVSSYYIIAYIETNKSQTQILPNNASLQASAIEKTRMQRKFDEFEKNIQNYRALCLINFKYFKLIFVFFLVLTMFVYIFVITLYILNYTQFNEQIEEMIEANPSQFYLTDFSHIPILSLYVLILTRVYSYRKTSKKNYIEFTEVQEEFKKSKNKIIDMSMREDDKNRFLKRFQSSEIFYPENEDNTTLNDKFNLDSNNNIRSFLRRQSMRGRSSILTFTTESNI